MMCMILAAWCILCSSRSYGHRRLQTAGKWGEGSAGQWSEGSAGQWGEGSASAASRPAGN